MCVCVIVCVYLCISEVNPGYSLQPSSSAQARACAARSAFPRVNPCVCVCVLYVC